MSVYLAGPIFGKTDAECKNWRDYVTTVLGADHVINPLDHDERGREDPVAIVERDKACVDRCSAVLAYCPEPSVGTSMEILYAWMQRKPVVVVVPTERVSPWIRYHATEVVSRLGAAIEIVQRWAR